MALPKELFEDSYAIPKALYTTNLDKLELFLYVRMWDDYEFYKNKYGLYAPHRARLAAYIGTDREDTATDVIKRLTEKGYVKPTGKRHNYRPIYEVIDFRTIENAIDKPRIEDRSLEKVEPLKAENAFSNGDNDDRTRKTSLLNAENAFNESGKREHSLCKSLSHSLYKKENNIIKEDSESNSVITSDSFKDTSVSSRNEEQTPHKEEQPQEDGKSLSLPLSDSLPSIVTPSLADSPATETVYKLSSLSLEDRTAFFKWDATSPYRGMYPNDTNKRLTYFMEDVKPNQAA